MYNLHHHKFVQVMLKALICFFNFNHRFVQKFVLTDHNHFNQFIPRSGQELCHQYRICAVITRTSLLQGDQW